MFGKLLTKITNLGEDYFKRIIKVVIILYFVLTLLPYIFSPIPFLTSIFTNTFVNLILRGVSFLLLVIVSFFTVVRKKPHIPLFYLCCSALLIIFCFLSIFFTKTTFHEVYDNLPYLYKTELTYKVGTISLISGFVSNVIDLAAGFIFLFIFPLVLKKEDIILLLKIVFFFTVAECLFSLIFEYRKYIDTIFGNDNYNGYGIDIRASFVSKNDFGAFLIIGFVSSLFLLFYTAEKQKIIYLIGTILISLISVLSLCKTAIIAIFVSLIILTIFYIRKLIVNRSYKKITVICSTVLIVILALVIILSLKSDIKLISKFKDFIQNRFFGALSKAFSDRINTWIPSLKIMHGHTYFIGYPKGSLYYAITISSNGAYHYPHNGFIQQFLCFGFLGVVLLLYSYSIICKRISKVRHNSWIYKMLIIVFLVSIVFMTTETEIVIMSSSALVYVFNIILSCNYKEEESNEIYNIEI